MRWASVTMFVCTVLTVVWLAVFTVDNLANQAKGNINFVDVAKLRFENYLRDFNKTYNNKEYERRFENFKESLKEISRLNRLENNTVFGLTKFSDMSKQEYAGRMLLDPLTLCTPRNQTCPNGQQNNETFINKTCPPRSFDWRKEGVVKPVLDQKRCNGCWAFSIVGVLESMSAIQLKDFKSRSIQELLDCSPLTEGCNKGNVVTAMDYICNFNMSFVTEEEYPMTLPMDRVCKLKPPYSGRRVKRFEHYCRMDEDLMVQYIAHHGPLVAAVDASNWQNYLGGVIRRACTRGKATHVVQIVGYEGYNCSTVTEQNPIPYYIVRNSAGVDFGEQGYVKVAMQNGNLTHNVCGIAEKVTAMDVF